MSNYKDDKKIDMELTNQLLHDIGEVDDQFVDRAADANIEVTSKGRRKPWMAVFASAAAVLLIIAVGRHLPEMSDDPMNPALTDISGTDTSVSQNDADVTVSEEDKDGRNVVTVKETVPVIVTDGSGVITVTPSETTVSETASDEQAAENTDMTAYPYPEDIKADHAAVTKNSDGSLRVTLGNGKFAFTLPASWEGHFVITSGDICAKKSFNESSGNGGEFFGYRIGDISDEETLRGAGFRNMPEFSTLRGVSGSAYLYTTRVTDIRYNESDAEAAEEYKKIEMDVPSILSGTESYSEQSGRMEKVMYLPDNEYFNAHIESWYSVKAERERKGEDYVYRAYDDNYVLAGGTEEDNRYWELEEGWNVKLKKAVQCENGLFYDCVDAEDGDHYKWVPQEDITFDLIEGH